MFGQLIKVVVVLVAMQAAAWSQVSSNLRVNGVALSEDGTSLNLPAGPTYPVQIDIANGGSAPATFTVRFDVLYADGSGLVNPTFDIVTVADIAPGATGTAGVSWDTAGLPDPTEVAILTTVFETSEAKFGFVTITSGVTPPPPPPSADVTPPSVPVILTPATGSVVKGRAVMSWTPSVDDSGGPVTYALYYSYSGSSGHSYYGGAGSKPALTETSYAHKFPRGVTVEWSVRAIDAAGNSSATANGTFTTAGGK